MLFGLLNLNKPAGISSAAALARIKPLVRPAKLGHAGTLDPIASGVLVVALGPATRLIERVQRMPKRYRATFLLGRRSPSDDVETAAVELENPPIPELASLREAAATFVGEIQQRPPAFSAVKVAGQRAYSLARAGRQVELAARPITVHQLDIVEYDYPRLVLDIRCGSGTYVRSLGRDLAESLGTAAVMSELVRTAVGPFCVEEACALRELNRESLGQHLLPALRAIEAALPVVQLSAAQIDRLRNGLSVNEVRDLPAGLDVGQELAALDPHGTLAAIVRLCPDGSLTPKINFVTKPPCL